MQNFVHSFGGGFCSVHADGRVTKYESVQALHDAFI